MRFKAISVIIVTIALMGASAGAALAMGNAGGSTGANAGIERFWVGNFSPKTGNPTTFIGTGLFTAAGRIVGPNGDKVVFPKGSFVVNMSKTTFGYTANPHTCLATVTLGGTIRLQAGTGTYAGISGKLTIGGKAFALLPRLKNGKCNEAQNAIPVAQVGTISGNGLVTLGTSPPQNSLASRAG